jgi:hypothetical protein
VGGYLLLCLLCLSGCCVPHSSAYRQFYSHLNAVSKSDQCSIAEETGYFLVVLVNARHLDYTECRSLIGTIAKHPSDGSKSADIGHAWICLQGEIEGQPFYLEGGHSGETGLFQARYFEGIINNVEYGLPNPTQAQCRECAHYEPDPVNYLWEVQQDGFFQAGSGGHRPSYALKVPLSREQFQAILAFIRTYDFANYSLQGNQCTTFAAGIAAIAGLELECAVRLQIPSALTLKDASLRLWSDARYSILSVPSPDVLEKSMMQAVREGRAACALEWYQKTHRKNMGAELKDVGELLVKFPERFARYLFWKGF